MYVAAIASAAEIEFDEAGQGIHETSSHWITIQYMHPRGGFHASRGPVRFSSSSGLSLSIYLSIHLSRYLIIIIKTMSQLYRASKYPYI